MAKRNTYTYICEDCTLMFQTFGNVRNNKQPYCPKCGDYINVSAQKGLHKTVEDVKNLKTRWSSEELQVLEKCIKGMLQPYQAALMLGRSKDSVAKKLKRFKDIKRGASV